MRFARRFAIALWLSFSAAGMACGRQDIARSANTDPQDSAASATPAHQLETKPTEPKAPEGGATKKLAAPAASPPKKRHKRPASAPGAPSKVVVREGGASEPAAQIAPDLSPAEAALQRNKTEQMLGFTDNQLKRLAEHPLDAPQQETVGQIHNYMDGARSALKEGDLRRASTLAQKAHLLSEDLMKR